MDNQTNERTPLHWAASNGDFQKVKELVQEGCDVNESDDCGWTPLISATSSGYDRIAAFLLENGANPNLKTKQGRDAFFYAVSKCQPKLTDLFLQYEYTNFSPDKFGSNCIHHAISNKLCNTDFLALLKKADAPFKATDGDGNTTMHLACYEKRIDLAEWLRDNADCSFEYPLNSLKKSPKEMSTTNDFY